jgi:hypothetical protein
MATETIPGALARTQADRLSGAPHAEFEREAAEAFQGIRAELDEIRNICRKLTEAVLVLAQPEPSRWARFRAWLYRGTPTS